MWIIPKKSSQCGWQLIIAALSGYQSSVVRQHYSYHRSTSSSSSCFTYDSLQTAALCSTPKPVGKPNYTPSGKKKNEQTNVEQRYTSASLHMPSILALVEDQPTSPKGFVWCT